MSEPRNLLFGTPVTVNFQSNGIKGPKGDAAGPRLGDSVPEQVGWAEKEIERLRKACMEIEHAVQQRLGKALGYPPLYPDASPVDDGQVCVGDHVAETLAVEAAKKIKRLQDENADLRKSHEEMTRATDDLLYSLIDAAGPRMGDSVPEQVAWAEKHIARLRK